MSRESGRGARLASSVAVASTAALAVFGVGIALQLPWLCMLAVFAMWAIATTFYTVLDKLGELDG